MATRPKDYLKNLTGSMHSMNQNMKRTYMPKLDEGKTNMYQLVNKFRTQSMRYRVTGKRAFGIYMNKTKGYFNDTFGNMKKDLSSGKLFGGDNSALSNMMDKYGGEEAATDYATSLGKGEGKTISAIESTAKAMTSGTDYLAGIIASGNSEAQMHSYQNHTETIGVLGNIQKLAEQQLNFSLNEVNNYMNASMQMYQESLGLLAQINQKLDVLVSARGAPGGFQKDSDLESVFGGSGSRFGKFMGRGMKNLKTEIKGYKDMVGMALGDFKDRFKKNPLGMIFQFGMNQMLSNQAKSKIGRANNNIGEILSSTMFGFNRMRDGKIKFDTGNKNTNNALSTLMSFIGGAFGIDTEKGMKLKTDDYKTQQITLEIENKKAKAITEVIPDYLGKILYSLSGVDMVYDYGQGKFMSRAARDDKFKKDIEDIKANASAKYAHLPEKQKQIAMINEMRNQYAVLQESALYSGNIGAMNGLSDDTFFEPGVGGFRTIGSQMDATATQFGHKFGNRMDRIATRYGNTFGTKPTGKGKSSDSEPIANKIINTVSPEIVIDANGVRIEAPSNASGDNTAEEEKKPDLKKLMRDLGERTKGLIEDKVKKRLGEFAWYNTIFGNDETGSTGMIGNISNAVNFAVMEGLSGDRDIFGKGSVTADLKKSVKSYITKSLHALQDTKFGESAFGKFLFGDKDAEDGSFKKEGLLGKVSNSIDEKILGPKGIIGKALGKIFNTERTRTLSTGEEETYTIGGKVNGFLRQFLGGGLDASENVVDQSPIPEQGTSDGSGTSSNSRGTFARFGRGYAPTTRGQFSKLGENGTEVAYLPAGSVVFNHHDSMNLLHEIGGNMRGYKDGTKASKKQEKAAKQDALRSTLFGKLLGNTGELGKDALISTMLTGSPVAGIIIGSLRNKALNKRAKKKAEETAKAIQDFKVQETGGKPTGEGGTTGDGTPAAPEGGGGETPSPAAEGDGGGGGGLGSFLSGTKRMVSAATISTLICGNPIPGLIIGALSNKSKLKKAKKIGKEAAENVNGGGSGEGKIKGFFKGVGTLAGAATISTLLTGSPVAGLIVGSIINKKRKNKAKKLADEELKKLNDGKNGKEEQDPKEKEAAAKAKKSAFFKRFFGHVKKADGKKFSEEATRVMANGGKEGQEAIDSATKVTSAVADIDNAAAETGNPADVKKAQEKAAAASASSMGNTFTKLFSLGKIGGTVTAITTLSLALMLGASLITDKINENKAERYVNERGSGRRRSGRGIPYFNQNDPRWGRKSFGLYGGGRDTIGAGGCGPTTAAMLLRGITGANINPEDAANYAMQYGYKDSSGGVGSDYLQSISGAYGVNTVSNNGLSANAMNALSSGVPVALMGRGGRLFGGGNHWVLARGTDGRNIYAYDPQNPSNNKLKFSVGEVGNNTIESVSPRVFVPVSKARGALINSKGNQNNYLLASARGSDLTEAVVNILQTINDNLVTIGNNIVNAGSSMKNSSDVTSYSAQRNSASKATQYTQAITA